MHAQNQKYTLTSVRVRLSWLQRATARRRGLNKISNRNSQDVHISDSTNCWHNKRHHSTTCIVYTAYGIYRRERYTRVFSVCWKQSNMNFKAFGCVRNSLVFSVCRKQSNMKFKAFGCVRNSLAQLCFFNTRHIECCGACVDY
jgi:hypothetical protein